MKKNALKVEIIGYDSGWGCKDYGCEDGAEAVPIERALHTLRHLDIEARWRGTLSIKFLGKHEELTTKEKTLPLVIEANRRLFNHVKHAVENNHTPIVLGGDHSCAIGTWSGVVSAMEAAQNFGLIWMDAHLDAHTAESAHEGKWGGWWHGQPVSALIGEGMLNLRNLGGTEAKISPKHISLIGVRSFEPAEEEFIKKHGIRVFFMDEVKKRGFDAVFADALARATNGTKGFGISIDMDSFDPEEAPGVGSPEKDGLRSADVLPTLKALGRHALFRGLEVVEINPHKDKTGKTALLAKKIIDNVFAKTESED